MQLRLSPLRIAIAGMLIALAVHLLNYLTADGHPFLHTTADDPSYLRPVENFLHHGTWKDNGIGASSYVQRPPLFGLIHGICYLISPGQSLAIAFALFLLLHGAALYVLPGIFRHFVSDKSAHWLALLYAALPCFWGFLSYSITEAISPSLVILLLAALLHDGKRSLFYTLLLITLIWFLRPVLLLLFPLVIYKLFRRRSELLHPRQAITGFLCLLSIFLWEYRKAGYMGHWGDPHPIYHVTNNPPFRPVHAALSDLFRTWETRPEVLHSFVHACWSEDSTHRSLSAVKAYCSERNVPMPSPDLYALLTTYHTVNMAYLQEKKELPRTLETSGERALRLRLVAETKAIRQAFPLRYHVLTPLQSASEQLRKSQLNLELFQVTFRGTFPVELLRYCCVFLLFILLTGSLSALTSRPASLRLMAIGTVIYCFYLFYVQRMNEDRYMIPLLPLIYVCGLVFWISLFRRICSRFSR